MPLYSQHREDVLSEFCIFAAFSEANIQKLISLNVMRHACRSFQAVNTPSMVVKALNLCGYLLSRDENCRAWKQLEVQKGLTDIIPFMDSAN